jgi:hypothetical protein
VPHIHFDSKAKTASCRPIDLDLGHGVLAAEASWEPLKGTISGQAGVISIFLHTFGVGIYFSLNRCGGEHLIKVGSEKQLKVGMKNTGIAGLTI